MIFPFRDNFEMLQFSHHDLQLLNPSFDSPLVDVLAEVEFLRRRRLEGDTPPRYAWILELLGEALVQRDEMLECEHNPQLSFRNTAGIHQAIRIISRLASEQCGKVMERNGHELEG